MNSEHHNKADNIISQKTHKIGTEWQELIACSLCLNTIRKSDSHNAQPINDERCCDDCNYSKVISERIKLMRNV